MAKNHNRLKSKYRRQYVFTRSKAIIGFVASCAFSILINAYLDKYGMDIYYRVKTGFSGQSQQALLEREAFTKNKLREELELLDPKSQADTDPQESVPIDQETTDKENSPF